MRYPLPIDLKEKEKMQILTNKISANKPKMMSAIAILLMMTSILLIAAPMVPSAKAAEVSTAGALPAGKVPAATTPTVCSLSVKPAVAGVGQYVLVNVWLNPSVTAARVIKTYEFTITKPDGTKVTFTQDAEPATTATWFDYTLDQVGVYKFDVDFTGCYFNGTNNEATESAYYLPSSAPQATITCQSSYNPSWPDEALPTDYWTRPIDFSHRDWWPILGNYPATGYDGTGDAGWSARYPDTNPYWSSQYGFIPWVPAPQSSHIAWMEVNNPAGIVGGQVGREGNTIASDLSTSPFLCNLAYGGRGYRMVAKPVPINDSMLVPTSTSQYTWQCFDLRTGQVYWEQRGITQQPTFIEYSTSVTTAAGSGGAVTAYLVYLSLSSNTFRLIKYNPNTGAATTNITIAVNGTISGTTYYKNQYVLSIQNLGSSLPVDQRYRLINWTISGTSTNFAARIASNTSYALSSLPSVIDWNTGLGAAVNGITTAGIMTAINATGYNVYTGQATWNHYFANYTMFSASCTVADHGKVAFNVQHRNDQYGAYVALDLATGNVAWESEVMDYPWSSTGFGAYGVASAYGLIIHTAYSGIVAINWTNGHIAWTYHKYALAPFESPYTDANGTEVYSFNSGVRIADGMVYAYNCEHTTTFPRTRGWSTCAVNMTTGEEVWSIAMSGNAAFGNNPDIGAVADGYMVEETALGYFVVYGMGKSATTVTAPDTVMPLGNGVVIRGAVMDMSPAQPNTPCVSKDSMTLQMEYLHLQMPIGGIWNNETITGVPVSLIAIDETGAVTDLGTVTTNGYYGTFEKAWTPPAQGTYQIIASFAGTESYGSSSAATAVSVGPATPAIEFPAQITPIDYTNTIMYAAVAIIVAVVLAVAVAVLLLRKK
jgi:hypothetical protein